MISCFTQVHQGFEDLIESLDVLASFFDWCHLQELFEKKKKWKKKLDKFIYIKYISHDW